ncbi:MAG: DUF2079 domain-containing protein, partial [Chloroflexi bacterium]|nr:DUF2079 domain-containing protein [Chloroflexota bacterium]
MVAPIGRDLPWPRRRAHRGLLAWTARRVAALLVLAIVVAHGAGYAWLSVQRHEAFHTQAEDLGFTDQVIWNWMRWQAFRFSLYEKAEFDTDANVRQLLRPDSFLAFHVEPMTILFTPLYYVWDDVRAILVAQAVLFALGGIPAARLAQRHLGGPWAGVVASASYALNPVGQWMLQSDFHTVALATPALLAMIDWLDTGRRVLPVLAGLFAMSAKEEVGLAVAMVALVAATRRQTRWAGLLIVLLGLGWTTACITYIIPRYSGEVVSPLATRYAHLGSSPTDWLLALSTSPGAYWDTLTRGTALSYLGTLALLGLPFALLAPEILAAAAPSLALNVLSSSPWMASGRAHYSGVVLGVLVAATLIGAGRMKRWLPCWISWLARSRGRQAIRDVPVYPMVVSLLLAGSGLAYLRDGIGPGADGFVVPSQTSHTRAIERILAEVPAGARISASSSLVPH